MRLVLHLLIAVANAAPAAAHTAQSTAMHSTARHAGDSPRHPGLCLRDVGPPQACGRGPRPHLHQLHTPHACRGQGGREDGRGTGKHEWGRRDGVVQVRAVGATPAARVRSSMLKAVGKAGAWSGHPARHPPGTNTAPAPARTHKQTPTGANIPLPSCRTCCGPARVWGFSQQCHQLLLQPLQLAFERATAAVGGVAGAAQRHCHLQQQQRLAAVLLSGSSVQGALRGTACGAGAVCEPPAGASGRGGAVAGSRSSLCT